MYPCVKVNPSGDWNSRPAGTSGGFLNRGAAAAGLSRAPPHIGAGNARVSRGFGEGEGDWVAPASVMSPQAMKLLSLIKSSQNQMGASRYIKDVRGDFLTAYIFWISLTTFCTRQELSWQRGAAGLEQLLEVLVQEGHIYTTCDQDHFMATDA